MMDDRLLLLARVDELSVVVAAMARAAGVGRTGEEGISSALPPGGEVEARVLRLWNEVHSDVRYLRAAALASGAEVDRLRDEGFKLGAEVEGLRGELVVARRELEAAEARAGLWRDEAMGLRAHRDEVVAELVAVQGGRWVRLGRWLRVGARGRRSGDA